MKMMQNPRVFGVNEKTWIFDHFPKGYISKNGGSIFVTGARGGTGARGRRSSYGRSPWGVRIGSIFYWKLIKIIDASQRK